MAVLMVGLRIGGRALPLAWLAEEGPANIGFEGQRKLLEQVLAWLPEGAKVLLSADRFYLRPTCSPGSAATAGAAACG
jgi:hypothetical protein